MHTNSQEVEHPAIDGCHRYQLLPSQAQGALWERGRETGTEGEEEGGPWTWHGWRTPTQGCGLPARDLHSIK